MNWQSIKKAFGVFFGDVGKALLFAVFCVVLQALLEPQQIRVPVHIEFPGLTQGLVGVLQYLAFFSAVVHLNDLVAHAQSSILHA